MRVDLIKTFQFEAAHARGGRLHGHSYVVDLKCSGACGERSGWLVDYADISNAFDPIYRALDHRRLEEVDGLADTSLAGIEAWLTARLKDVVPFFDSVRACIVGDCKYAAQRVEMPDGIGGPARLRFGFESAHYLPNVPVDHKCRRMHGHSFRVEIAAPDLAALEPHARAVYDVLDRRCLNEIAGLENATSEMVARWIWNTVIERAGELTLVSVAETCSARCVYRGA